MNEKYKRLHDQKSQLSSLDLERMKMLNIALKTPGKRSRTGRGKEKLSKREIPLKEGQQLRENDKRRVRKKYGVYDDNDINHMIPCLYLENPRSVSNLFLLYFHSNGEDLKSCYALCDHLRKSLSVNVIAVEYPGYSVYKGEPSEDRVKSDSLAVYKYLTRVKEIPPIFGRSIGTGPATFLASKKEVGLLCLISPFSSIRAVVSNFWGILGKMGQYVVKDHFRNIDLIKDVRAPIFLIHGMKDEVISHKNAIELYEQIDGAAELIMPKKMTHSELNFSHNLTEPLLKFMRKIKFQSTELNKFH